MRNFISEKFSLIRDWYPAPLNSASNLLGKYHDGYTFLCLLEKE